MARIADVIGYICRKYPHEDELTKGRLTKMVYLADWRCAVKMKRQMTSIVWEFNHYGPFVDDVYNAAQNNGGFDVVPSRNQYGSPIEIIRVRSNFNPNLDDDDEEIIDEVISEVEAMNWSQFIGYVYDTYPIKTRPRYSTLDLVPLAKEYRVKCKELDEFAW